MTAKPIQIFGKKIILHIRNDGDLAIANELFLDHQYRFCDEVIKKAKHAIIDIGGHLGFFTLYASLLNSKVPIYSFEPHEGNFALLKQNLKENRVKNTHPKQVAVGGSVGAVQLMISKEDLNHSTTHPLEPTGKSQAVQQTTLERIFVKNRLDSCDLIKIDCEGAEFEMLYHCPDSVFKKTHHLFIEYHEWNPQRHKGQQLKDFLIKKGYRVEMYPNSKIKGMGFLWCVKNTLGIGN